LKGWGVYERGWKGEGAGLGTKAESGAYSTLQTHVCLVLTPCGLIYAKQAS